MRFCRSCGSSLAAAPAPAPPVAYGAPPGGIVTTPGTGLRGAAPAGGAPIMSAPALSVPPLPTAPPLAPPPLAPPPTVPPLAPPMAPPVAAALPVTVPASPLGTITCGRCGTATPAGFAFCQQCGSPVGAAAAPIAAPAAAPIAPPAAAPVAAPAPETRSTIGPAVGRPAPAPSGAWGEAILVNRDGSDGQRFALASEDVVIGRAGADVAFDEDRFLARQHARLSRAGGEVKVHALDPVNGVFKKADGPVELAEGAVILVGREVLRFERIAPEERTVHPLVRHGVALFGSPPRDPWGRIVQLIPSGGYRDVRHLAGDEIVLGREEGDLVFRDDAFMSRRHAAITWNGQRAQLVDLGSSNGTFVRIAGATPLKHGDHVRLGDQLLRIELR